jgi:ketopantoate reductase
MKTLVHGAGPLGSYCAAKLHEASVDISLLAHGQRKIHHVPVVEEIDANSAFELIIVTAPKYIFTNDDMTKLLAELAKNKTASARFPAEVNNIKSLNM